MAGTLLMFTSVKPRPFTILDTTYLEFPYEKFSQKLFYLVKKWERTQVLYGNHIDLKFSYIFKLKNQILSKMK